MAISCWVDEKCRVTLLLCMKFVNIKIHCIAFDTGVRPFGRCVYFSLLRARRSFVQILCVIWMWMFNVSALSTQTSSQKAYLFCFLSIHFIRIYLFFSSSVTYTCELNKQITHRKCGGYCNRSNVLTADAHTNTHSEPKR